MESAATEILNYAERGTGRDGRREDPRRVGSGAGGLFGEGRQDFSPRSRASGSCRRRSAPRPARPPIRRVRPWKRRSPSAARCWSRRGRPPGGRRSSSTSPCPAAACEVGHEHPLHHHAAPLTDLHRPGLRSGARAGGGVVRPELDRAQLPARPPRHGRAGQLLHHRRGHAPHPHLARRRSAPCARACREGCPVRTLDPRVPPLEVLSHCQCTPARSGSWSPGRTYRRESRDAHPQRHLPSARMPAGGRGHHLCRSARAP